MGHSSKHEKSKRHGRKGTRSDKNGPRPSTTQLQALITDVEERQQSLARLHDEYSHLREQADNLYERLQDAEQTLELLSSTSLAAQQARGVASLSGHPGQETIDRSSRKQHLLLEVQNLPASIDEYNRRADAMAELIARNQHEIESLRARIDEIRAVEEAEAEAAWYGEQQGGPDQGWGGDPSSGGGGGSYGYSGGGQASSSASYGHYGGAYT